jgi:hypothetical protein
VPRRKNQKPVPVLSPAKQRQQPLLDGIKEQIRDAATDLQAYRPKEIDWSERANSTADSLIPWLIAAAPGLKDYVQDVLNAPRVLRSLWTQIRPHIDLPKEQLEAFDRQLTLDDVLRESVNGEVVSKVVTKYLLEHHPTRSLEANGRSDYPDIYLTTLDYTALPEFKRKIKVTPEDEYGAAKAPRSRARWIGDQDLSR